MSISVGTGVSSPKSVHDLVPIEFGGETGRIGFTFQDYVAVHFLLKMLLENDILEVWCETQDDITLILAPSSANGLYEVEFVQVKGNELTQLWSIAELCKPDSGAKNKLGTSILEKSLAYDRCMERCRFRIVTLRDVNDDLKLLRLPLSSPLRVEQTNEKFLSLCTEIGKKRVKEFLSPNQNDYKFWLHHTIWQVGGERSAIQNENLIFLMRLVNAQGFEIFPDQLDEIHSRLLQLAKDAAEYEWVIAPSKKKISKSFLHSWLNNEIKKSLAVADSSRNNKLTEKLENANLNDYIEGALESRRYYLNQVRTSEYLELAKREDVVGEIAAILHHLKSEFDVEDEDASGVKFHSRCLQELKKLREQNLDENCPSLRFFQGCMYDITNRCVHRFTRPRV